MQEVYIDLHDSEQKLLILFSMLVCINNETNTVLYFITRATKMQITSIMLL